MVISLDEDFLAAVASEPMGKNLREAKENLQRVFSETDIANYRTLEDILYAPMRDLQNGAWGSLEHRFSIAEAFDSPIYSDACKRYFAASRLGYDFVLSAADNFLTERIIASYFENPGDRNCTASYFAVLLKSEHLSERIVSAVVRNITNLDGLKVLDLIPDSMITPEVLANWLSSWMDHVSSEGRLITSTHHKIFAGQRVKQVHPEYADFPDEWALHIFCGGESQAFLGEGSARPRITSYR